MLRHALARTLRNYPFEIDAFVVLPDHLHTIWTLRTGDADFSTRWRLIKTRFVQALPKQDRRAAVWKARNKRGIWQRRFWEHLIRNEDDAKRVEYCYINPVKHRLIGRVRDWPHSSFDRGVRRRIVPQDWAGTIEASGEFGEAL